MENGVFFPLRNKSTKTRSLQISKIQGKTVQIFPNNNVQQKKHKKQCLQISNKINYRHLKN